MKKLIFILSFLGFALTGAYAQNQTEGGFTQHKVAQSKSADEGRSLGKSINAKSQRHNAYELAIGPRLGVGLAIGSNGKGFDMAKSGFGFDGGLGLNLRFGNKDSKGRPIDGRGLIGVGVELNYALRSLGTNGDKNLSLGYFEVPVLVQFYPGFATKQLRNLYIEVGPTFSALVNKSPDVLLYDGLQYGTGNLKGGDVKVSMGLGYRFSQAACSGFYLNFRYNLGTSDLAGNLPVKTSSAELTFGYLFKCAGGSKAAATKTDKVTKQLNKITF